VELACNYPSYRGFFDAKGYSSRATRTLFRYCWNILGGEQRRDHAVHGPTASCRPYRTICGQFRIFLSVLFVVTIRRSKNSCLCVAASAATRSKVGPHRKWAKSLFLLFRIFQQVPTLYERFHLQGGKIPTPSPWLSCLPLSPVPKYPQPKH